MNQTAFKVHGTVGGASRLTSERLARLQKYVVINLRKQLNNVDYV
jgi:hypothetical protein